VCGINGSTDVDVESIERMNDTLSHRGPDGSDCFIDNRVCLGHTRLSIIDLSQGGTQPMMYRTKDGSIIRITFNGEIYNYVELKKELLISGYHFNTQSDTEVILACYDEYGYECVNKFNGMWAFCIYDESRGKLFLSRDRLGVKPLYYTELGSKFTFSSELKGILSNDIIQPNSLSLNREAIQLYFSLGFIPSPFTIFRDIHKLPACHNLVFDLGQSVIERRWKYFDVIDADYNSMESELLQGCNDIISDAVEIRMRSDVEVGAFLSGGLDSTSVVQSIKSLPNSDNLHTFSVGFEEGVDETYFIKLAAREHETIHHHMFYTESDFSDHLEEVGYVFDEPFADSSLFPMLKLSEVASREVTVVLSGDGGDEMFGGYPNYMKGINLDVLRSGIGKFVLNGLNLIRQSIPFSWNARLIDELNIIIKNPANLLFAYDRENRYYPDIYQKWSKLNFSYALEKSDGSISEALRLFDLLYGKLADNFLTKVDRASMNYGLEVRSPYLDFRLINFSQKIPRKLKYSRSEFKILLKKVFTGRISNEIIGRSKQGFTPPFDLWIDRIFGTQSQASAIEILKDIDKDLYEFYVGKVLNGNSSKLISIYKLRLLIFYNWYKTWRIESKS